jgi:hypothetical protein
MSDPASVSRELPPKVRRALELAYAVEGVVSARVWQWPGCVAVGIRGSGTSSAPDLLRRVQEAVAGLQNPDESWEFGILDDETIPPPHEA